MPPLALTALQKAAAQAIVQIFETGSVLGDYGAVTVLAGDTGHLTYGKAQTTLASGNLFHLIRTYCEAQGAMRAHALRPFLPRLAARDTSLDHDAGLRVLLRAAGIDPVMRAVQDQFSDRRFWQPALRSAAYIGAEMPLGIAIVNDSRIHGSWHRMRDEVIAAHGKLANTGERDWMRAYVDHRHRWLAGHPNPVLHPTVYRMEAFERLIDEGNWSLALPFTVRARRIDEFSLGLAQAA